MTFGSMTSAPYDSGLSKQTAGKSLGGLLCPTRDMDLAGPCSHSPSPGGIFRWSSSHQCGWSAHSVSVWLVSSVSQCVAGSVFGWSAQSVKGAAGHSSQVNGWLVSPVSVWLVSPVSQCGWSSGKSLLMQELMQPATPLPHPPTISTLAHAPLT